MRMWAPHEGKLILHVEALAGCPHRNETRVSELCWRLYIEMAQQAAQFGQVVEYHTIIKICGISISDSVPIAAADHGN